MPPPPQCIEIAPYKLKNIVPRAQFDRSNATSIYHCALISYQENSDGMNLHHLRQFRHVNSYFYNLRVKGTPKIKKKKCQGFCKKLKQLGVLSEAATFFQILSEIPIKIFQFLELPLTPRSKMANFSS